MASYVYHGALTKAGEDVCGDTVKYTAVEDSVFAVLSDGLGSGVKANILSTLTVEILHGMGAAGLPLEVIFETVTRALPVCRERGIAYSAFVVAKVDRDGWTQLWSYDMPDPILICDGHVLRPRLEPINIGGRTVRMAELAMSRGDGLFLISDGVPFAGLGQAYNHAWGWNHVADFVASTYAANGGSVSATVKTLIGHVDDLYHHRPGDDATVLGVEVRRVRKLIVFTGPPLDAEADGELVRRFLTTPGEKAVCGGTTANMISRETGWHSEVDAASGRPDVPPMSTMEGIDLVTEGVVTLAKTIDLLRAADGQAERLPDDRNGAVCLARALLAADHVHFFVGLSAHSAGQHPMLPISVSLRRFLVEELQRQLTAVGRSVVVEYH